MLVILCILNEILSFFAEPTQQIQIKTKEVRIIRNVAYPTYPIPQLVRIIGFLL